MEETILETRRLSVGYDGVPVVRHMDLRAQRGTVTALIGPNGAGKSTVLKTLIRQIPPLSGEILLYGKSMRSFSARDLAESVAAMLTGYSRQEWTTCREMVSCGRYPYTGRLGILSKRDQAVVDEVMELTDLQEIADQPVSRISDGQRQRVLLARAICQEPELLILDEPTSYLDIRYQMEFMELLRNLAKQRRMAVVLSMHELAVARRYSDQIYCLKDGTVQYSGPPENLTDGVLEALYDLKPGSLAELYRSV